MNFTPENAQNVIAGTKTQTRRICGNNDAANSDATFNANIIEVFRNSKSKWRVGRTYAVCPGRGKKSIGRIRITNIRLESVQDISRKDAIAELGWGKPCNDPACPKLFTDHWNAAEHWWVNDVSKNESDARYDFMDLWDSIYEGQKGKQWEDNPEVWALTFEVVKPAS